LKML